MKKKSTPKPREIFFLTTLYLCALVAIFKAGLRMLWFKVKKQVSKKQ